MDGWIDMDRRLADLPVLAARPDRIGASTYNLWRRARGRWGSPLRFSPPDLKDLGLREMALVLSDRYWVCADTTKNDLPVLAWVALEDDGRSALHTDVACRLNYYHFAASALRARCLAGLETVLSARLRAG